MNENVLRGLSLSLIVSSILYLNFNTVATYLYHCITPSAYFKIAVTSD